jgi:hypothetical protein
MSGVGNRSGLFLVEKFNSSIRIGLFDVFEDQPQAVKPSEGAPKRLKKDKHKKRQVNGQPQEENERRR